MARGSSLRRLLIGIGVLSGHVSVCLAQHAPIDQGMPCLDEVCVGDTLQSLLKLPWHPVKPQADATVILPLVAEDDVLDQLSRYWGRSSFDAEGFRALAKVQAVCQDLGVWRRPKGTFSSREGWLTVVSFDPVPGATGGGQAFRVATITRIVSPGTPASEVREYADFVQSAYGGLAVYPTADQPGARWLHTATEGVSLTLFAPLGDPQARAAALERQPLCSTDRGAFAP